MHQPLHAVSMWSDQFPDGDRGGNLFIVRADGRNTNLHSYWDGLLGGYTSPRLIAQVAEKVTEDNPRDKLELKTADPIAWARESERAAREVAYLDGRLRGISRAAADADRSMAAPELPEGYAAHAREVARRQVALAGNRLSAGLNQALR